MTREEYNKFIDNLEKKGYQFSERGICDDAPNYYKVIEHRNDNDGKQRAVCQLLFYLYDFSGVVIQEDFAYEPVICVSRNTDERINITLSRPKLSVEEYENIAVEFMKFIDNNIKLKGGNKC